MFIVAKREILFFAALALASFFLNFFWESLHGLLFQGHPAMQAVRYVPMMLEMSCLDTVSISGLYLFVSLVSRSLVWQNTFRNCVIFVSAALIADYGTEYAAVHIRHEWGYLPEMPQIFGVGLLPLVQLALTGLSAIVIAGKVSEKEKI
jgi:hypothetical protein